MKRALILGILGSGAVAMSSFGQNGAVYFGNYGNSGPIAGTAVTYASLNVPAGKAGETVGSDFSAELLYLVGSVYTAIPSSITPFYGTDGGGGVSGYTSSTFAYIPGTSDLGGTTVSLEWEAFNNVAIGGDAAGTITGKSGPFTAITSNYQAPTANDFAPLGGGDPTGSAVGFTGFTVSAVPEPTTIALLGLGAAGLLAAHRRKA